MGAPMIHTKETIAAFLAAQESAPCACGRNGTHRVCPQCGEHADALPPGFEPATVVYKSARGRTVMAPDQTQLQCPCNADEPATLRPISAATLSPWDTEFLTCQLVRLSAKRPKPLSPKVIAVLDKIVARASAPAVKRATVDRDALDVSPKRGRTWAAMVKACRFSIVRFEMARDCGGYKYEYIEAVGSDVAGLAHNAANAARAAMHDAVRVAKLATATADDPASFVHTFGDDETACPVCGLARRGRVERIDMFDSPSREIVAAVRADIRAQIADVTGWDKLPDADAFSDAMRVMPEKSPIGKVLAQLLDWHKYAVNVGILTLA